MNKALNHIVVFLDHDCNLTAAAATQPQFTKSHFRRSLLKELQEMIHIGNTLVDNKPVTVWNFIGQGKLGTTVLSKCYNHYLAKPEPQLTPRINKRYIRDLTIEEFTWLMRQILKGEE